MNNTDLVESFSGIRGIFGQSITKEFAYKYAMAFCRLFCNRNSVLVIAGDSRPSTPELRDAMIQAFKDFGIKKIIDLGLVPVQVAEYAVLKFKASGGVYITASHNEPEFNGWKFLKKDGAILYANQAEELIKESKKDFKISAKKPITKITNKNKEAINNYINFVVKKIGKKSLLEIKKSNFKVLADPNGGSSIAILEKLFSKIGVKAEIVNKNIGEFKREVIPNSKTLAYLDPIIKAGNFDFACGFDCDADRVEFVLPGQMVSGQYVLALTSDALLNGTQNQVVVTNDCTSYLIRDIIKKYKAKMKEVEVGETNVVTEMEKQKSIIGGEGSNGGVVIMPIKCRDGIMTTVLILKLLAQRKKSLLEILSEYPKYYSERAERQCSVEKAIEIKNNIEKYFREKGYKIKKTGGTTGGLKILFDDSSYVWFRLSKTEPGNFRIISDGDDKKKVDYILNEGQKIFDNFKN